MGGFLRKVRGILKTGLTWAVGWGGAFGLIEVGTSVVFGFPFALLASLTSGAVLGFISGGIFAGILSVAERNRTLDQLSLKRVALWGAIGGAALFLLVAPRMLGAGLPLGMLVTAALGPMAFASLLGAGSAAGSVAIARRGDEELIEGVDEASLLDAG